MDKPNQKAKNFVRLTAMRGVKTQIAQALGVEPAVVNNWRYRGVPTAYAYKVAAMLKCRPWDISDVLPTDSDLDPARTQARIQQLTPDRQEQLSNYLDFLLQQQSRGD